MQDYAADEGYPWADAAIKSLEALAEHFGAKVVNYNVGSCRFEVPENLPLEDAAWLAKLVDALGTFNPKTLKGNGDCVLTGVCFDEDAIDGLRAAYNAGERNLNNLLQAGFQTWLEATQADCADFYSADQFEEHADANNYEYLKNGEMYSDPRKK